MSEYHQYECEGCGEVSRTNGHVMTDTPDGWFALPPDLTVAIYDIDDPMPVLHFCAGCAVPIRQDGFKVVAATRAPSTGGDGGCVEHQQQEES